MVPSSEFPKTGIRESGRLYDLHFSILWHFPWVGTPLIYMLWALFWDYFLRHVWRVRRHFTPFFFVPHVVLVFRCWRQITSGTWANGESSQDRPPEKTTPEDDG